MAVGFSEHSFRQRVLADGILQNREFEAKMQCSLYANEATQNSQMARVADVLGKMPEALSSRSDRFPEHQAGAGQ